MLNPFDSGLSPRAAAALHIRPRAEEFPLHPSSAAEGEALLARPAWAPDGLRAAAGEIGPALAGSVLGFALVWEGWLDALERLAAGERLALGGNIVASTPDERSPAGLLARLAVDRAGHVAGLRRRGPELWNQAAVGTDGLPLTAYALLSAVAANDAEPIEGLRGGGSPC